MIVDRPVAWLVRHPVATVLLALGVVAAVSAALVSLATGPSDGVPAGTPSAEVSPYTLPRPTQHPPQARVDSAHAALHALGRACRTPRAQRDPQTVRRPLDQVEAFADDFPSGGFRIDDEPGTTLALLFVVWDELKTCDPSVAPEIERRLPADYRSD